MPTDPPSSTPCARAASSTGRSHSAGTTTDLHTAELLLESPDPRSARLGRELLSALAAAEHLPGLAHLADDPRLWVRLTALHALAASGDVGARAALADDVRTAGGSDAPDVRARAAVALSSSMTSTDSPCSGGSSTTPPPLCGVPRSMPCTAMTTPSSRPWWRRSTTRAPRWAGDAVGRLGDAALPAAGEALLGRPRPTPDSPKTLRAVRLARALTTVTEARDALLTRWAAHPDREVGRVVLERLAVAAPPPAPRGGRRRRRRRRRHARGGGARSGRRAPRRAGAGATRSGELASTDGHEPLSGALADELALVSNRVLAALVARYGTERLGPVTVGLMVAAGRLRSRWRRSRWCWARASRRA